MTSSGLPADSRTVDLIIVGAQKCGTTSLFRYLGAHPGVRSHPQREMSYFLDDAMYEEGWDEAFQKYFDGASGSHRVLLAKHVMLMQSDKALRRLKAHNPAVEIVVCLRDPVARAHSAYWYARRRGWETIETFEDALEAEADRIARDGWEAWRRCAYVYNGQYLSRIAKLFREFDREQVFVFLTDDLRASPRTVCGEILRSVGLELSPEMNLDARHNTSRRVRFEWLSRLIARLLRRGSWFRESVRPWIPDGLAYRLRHAAYAINETEGQPPEIDPSTARFLRAHFAEDNERLGELIGRDLSMWNRGAGERRRTGAEDPPSAGV